MTSSVAEGFRLSSELWPPQHNGLTQTIALLEAGVNVCLYGPTGSGKTRMAIELIRWATYYGIPSVFYVNRRLLIGQTYERFYESGMDVGVRAADYEDLDRSTAMVQIASADTERSRVYKRKIWRLHDAGLVIVDEAHIQRGETMDAILRDYRAMGARVVLLTATPLGIAHMADQLVVSGTMQDYRNCRAIVPAVVRSIEQPDMSKVKRRDDGEFAYEGKDGVEFKRRYTQQIVGNVIERWRRYNPDARPTFLYAPGRAESAWLTEQFWKQGVRWGHIDADEVYLDGKRYKRSRGVWTDLLAMFVDGHVKGISSRFVLREGVDVPTAYHAILACPIGSMASYVQTVGRILRFSAATADTVLVTDHGGNYWRHGSPNATRPWADWWGMDEGEVSRQAERVRRETGQGEPVRCPNCETERKGGIVCPICGFEFPRGLRYVIQVDGTMKEVEGPLVKKIRTQRRSDTEKKWTDLFWAWRRSKKTQDKSMAQLEGFFTHKYGYHAPRDLPFMPKRPTDWAQRVSTVDFDLLIPGR